MDSLALYPKIEIPELNRYPRCPGVIATATLNLLIAMLQKPYHLEIKQIQPYISYIKLKKRYKGYSM